MVADAWQDMFLHAVKHTIAPLASQLKVVSLSHY